MGTLEATIPDEPFRLQYYLARRCYRLRNERTPSGKCTWERLFELKTGMLLSQYIKEATEKDYKGMIRAYEMERFGRSAV